MGTSKTIASPGLTSTFALTRRADTTNGRTPPQNQISEAQKHARYAVSALGFSDVKTALENLEKATRILTSGSSPS